MAMTTVRVVSDDDPACHPMRKQKQIKAKKPHRIYLNQRCPKCGKYAIRVYNAFPENEYQCEQSHLWTPRLARLLRGETDRLEPDTREVL